MFFMDDILKSLIKRFMPSQICSKPESQIEKIKEMSPALPDSPREGNAPIWTAREVTATDGRNGEDTSG